MSTCRLILAVQNVIFITLIFVQNLCRLHEAAEGADFPKFCPDPLGVAKNKSSIIIHREPKKGGRTFVTITLENLDGFLKIIFALL